GGSDATGGGSSSGGPGDSGGTTDGGATDGSAKGDAGAADTGASGEAGPCAIRTGHRGLTSRSLTVGSLKRTYLIYLPEALDPSTPVPFVFVHHGLTMSGQAMYLITQYTALADAQGLGVAFPDGQSGPNSFVAPWNVGSGVCLGAGGVQQVSATGDDFAFIEAMKVDVAQDQCLDAAHVFVTGFSMGGYFAHNAGCMMPDVRAVAPHSGGTHDLSACTNAREPILIFHGDADPVVPDGCDDPGASKPIGWSGPASADAWAAHNGCATTTTSTAVTGGTCTYYDGCPAGGQVAYCVLKGMGHCWAGGAADGGVFSCPNYASATALEWAFFQKYAW
ncbi:MAG: alpha/beta hydrolase family esterase, partial [Polyangiaceae bacterium]